jgi:PAS domain S-box-containing protein
MVQRAASTGVTERYEALLRVSQTLISARSWEKLLSILARELRAVAKFDYLGLAIYDEEARRAADSGGHYETHLKISGDSDAALPGLELVPEETFTLWVYQNQQPLVIPALDAETRFPPTVAFLKGLGVRSICTLPLTTLSRRLGGIALGSGEADAYSREEVSFLSLVANQVALAVDDAVDFDAPQRAKDALQSSEQRFRLILDNIPGLVSTRAATGAPEFVNQQMREFFGPSLEHLPDWSSLIHPDDRERVVSLWRRSVETGQPYDVEHRARRADGVYRWIHARGQSLRDPEGRIVRWCTMLTDVDDRKRAEEGLRERELNFRVIIDSIPGLVHTLTAAGEVEFVNQQNLRYFGKTLEELKDWASNDVFHPEDLPRVIASWNSTLETGQPDEIECRLRRADGVYRWFQLRCLPLRDSEGRIIRWMSLHTDIDDRKRVEEALRASELNLRLIVDTIPGLVCTMNASGEIELLNRRVLEYFGKTTEELKSWATATSSIRMTALA